MSRLSTLLSELRRRRVYHVGVLYAATAFVIAQAAEIFLPRLGLPDWTVTFVVVVIVVGFPIALILGWVFEITPSGVRRTEPEAAPDAWPRHWRVAAGSAVVVLVFLAAGWWLSNIAFQRSSPIRSLAVLPLSNLLGDTDQDYFVEGMHEALITELSKIGALKVISRTSTLRYRDTDKAMPQIARDLGVDALIEGSVLREGEQVRITVQLIHGPSDRHVWAQSYQRSLRNILLLQREVAGDIASRIAVRLTRAEELLLATARPVDPEAYTLYLKGNFEGIRRSYRDAAEYYRQAIAIDPDYAPAYAGLALAAIERSFFAGASPSEFQDGASLAREAALKAIELEPALADAYIALARIRHVWDWDWTEADATFRRGLELTPSSTVALLAYHNFLIFMGRPDEAVIISQIMVEREPFAGYPLNSFAFALMHLGRFREALEYNQRAITLDPDNLFIRVMRAELYVLDNRFEEALREADSISQHTTRLGTVDLARLGYVYAKANRHANASAIFDFLTMRAETEYVSPTLMALLSLAMDRQAAAFRFLEEAYRERDHLLVLLRGYYMFDPIRDDRRFRSLIERMEFPA